MPIKKSTTLGRDLGDLLSKAVSQNTLPLSKSSDSSENKGNIFELPTHALRPGKYQPRLEIHESELEFLANSIQSQGILQPLLVRPIAFNQYEILAGERRFQAARRLQLEKVPVIIKEVGDKEALAIALIENIQRENLNPLEEAQALDRLTKEFNLTHIQAAEIVGKSRATVTNLLRLLTLAEDVKALLKRGDIEMGHAKVLLPLRGSLQGELARKIVNKKMSVREAERVVAHMLDENRTVPKKPTLDPDVRRLQENISEKLCARVEIQASTNNKGKLVIHYNSLEELDGIIAHFRL